jgi:hypothetical protein
MRNPPALIATSIIAILAAGIGACSSLPSTTTPQASPLVSGSGLVIGTLSYQYVELAEPRNRGAWVVHFDRLDRPDTQQAQPTDYALAVNVDPDSNSGVFTGALPAGVYAFREAASANRRFAVGTLKMPFEVQAGAVQDAGHYALNPLN